MSLDGPPPEVFEATLAEAPCDEPSRTAAFLWYGTSARDLTALRRHTLEAVRWTPWNELIYWANVTAFYGLPAYRAEVERALVARVGDLGHDPQVVLILAEVCAHSAFPPRFNTALEQAEFRRWFTLPPEWEAAPADRPRALRAAEYFRLAMEYGRADSACVAAAAARRAALLIELGEYVAAEEACLLALPEASETLERDLTLRLAHALWFQHQAEPAIARLTDLIARDAAGFEGRPGCATFHARLLVGEIVLVEQRDAEAACAALRQAVAITPCGHMRSERLPLALPRRLLAANIADPVADFCAALLDRVQPGNLILRELFDQACGVR
jgi:hypothetical protein